MAFAKYASLTVTGNATLLPSTQSNFPLLVKITDNSLKTVGNGGSIQNTVTQASGTSVTMPADLVFSTDNAGVTKIPWEVEFYDGTNGILWAWVKVSSLALGTVIYAAYGDATISTAQNTSTLAPVNVWSSYSGGGVYHLAAGLSLVDSVAGLGNGTNHSAAATTSGQVGGGATFNGTSQYIDLGNTGFHNTALSVECWAKFTSVAADTDMVTKGYNGISSVEWKLYLGSGGKASFRTANNALGHGYTGVLASSATLTTATWYHIVGTLTVGNLWSLYINGALDTSNSGDPTENIATLMHIGALTVAGSPGEFMTGSLDEVRIRTSADSADWVTATYSNQNAPNTFVTVVAGVSPGGGKLSSYAELDGMGGVGQQRLNRLQ